MRGFTRRGGAERTARKSESLERVPGCAKRVEGQPLPCVFDANLRPRIERREVLGSWVGVGLAMNQFAGRIGWASQAIGGGVAFAASP